MGMREEVLKLAEECGASVGSSRVVYRGEPITNFLERFYRAASLQAAERMKEEAASVVAAKLDDAVDEDDWDTGWIQGTESSVAAIRAIDVNKLFGE